MCAGMIYNLWRKLTEDKEDILASREKSLASLGNSSSPLFTFNKLVYITTYGALCIAHGMCTEIDGTLHVLEGYHPTTLYLHRLMTRSACPPGLAGSRL
jgi:hypothetical protein